MRRIGFLAKIAFICNLFFLGCIYLQSSVVSKQSETVSLIAILGIVLGMGLANPVSNVVNGIMLLKRKPLFDWVPKWLVLVNFGFLLVQSTYFLHIWS